MNFAVAYVAVYGELSDVEHAAIVGERRTLCGQEAAIIYRYVNFESNSGPKCEQCTAHIHAE